MIYLMLLARWMVVIAHFEKSNVMDCPQKRIAYTTTNPIEKQRNQTISASSDSPER